MFGAKPKPVRDVVGLRAPPVPMPERTVQAKDDKKPKKLSKEARDKLISQITTQLQVRGPRLFPVTPARPPAATV